MDPGRINTKRITPRHMMIKLLKSKEKERILKAEKDVTLQRRMIIWMGTGLLVKTNEVKVAQSCLTLCAPHGLKPARLLCPGVVPDKNTGVGCFAFLKGIFPTYAWKPGLLHCRWILYSLSHREAPKQWRPKADDKNQDNGDQTTWKSEKKQMSLFRILYILIKKKWRWNKDFFR